MKAAEAMIFWTPTSWADHPNVGQISVWERGSPQASAAWPSHAMKVGAAFTHWQEARGDLATALVFIEFQTAVVRDGIDPQKAHDAFLQIDEYREACAPDVRGAAR